MCPHSASTSRTPPRQLVYRLSSATPLPQAEGQFRPVETAVRHARHWLLGAIAAPGELVFGSGHGPDEKALAILGKVGREFDVPTVTDIHETTDAALAAAYVDVLQILAFLVRQHLVLIPSSLLQRIALSVFQTG